MAQSDRVAQILLDLLSSTADDDAIAHRLVTAAQKALQVTGVGLAWMTETGPGGTLAATPGAAQRLEELQYTLGEGPGVDSSKTSHDELHAHLAKAALERWPGFTTGALDAGIAAVFALPLHLGGIKIGVLDIYSDTAGRLDEAAAVEARAFASAATAVLLHLQSSADRGSTHSELADTMLDQAEVHQATGMISVQLKSSLSDAFAVLRGRAFASGTAITEIAHRVVTRELRFTVNEE